MALKLLEVYNDLESNDGDTPDAILVDIDYFTDIRDKAVEALKSVDGNYMVFWFQSWGKDMKLLQISYDNDVSIAEDEDNFYSEFDKSKSEVRWGSNSIKVYADGAVQLFCESKDSDESFWVDLV